MDLLRLGPKNLIYTSDKAVPMLQFQAKDISENYVLGFILFASPLDS